MGSFAHASLSILAVVSVCPTASAATDWTNVSSGLAGQPQGVRSLVIDRSGSTLYALGNQAFKSTDGGFNWRLLGGITGAAVLALDPVSLSTVYAGTSHGVWKSTDAGESWTFAGLPATAVTTIVIDPLTPATLYAASSTDRVYKSTDGGANWTSFAVGFSVSRYFGVASILIDPSIPSTVYVMPQGEGSPLYKSMDGAQTWSEIDSGPFFRLLAITPSTLYAIVAPLGLSTSTDGGASWTFTGFPKDVLSMAFEPGNGNIVYGSVSAPAGSSPALYKSSDGGRNWSPLNAAMPFAGPLALNPINPSVIYGASYSAGVFRSGDAGKNWSAMNTGLAALGIKVLVSDPSSASTVYAGGDGGLFKSTDSGGSWQLQAAFQAAGVPAPALPPPVTGIPSPATASVHSMLIDSKNPRILYIGTARLDGCFYADVLLYKSVDAGSTWSGGAPDQSGCSDDTLLAMDSTNSTVYIRSGDDYDGYGLRKSTDGGATWTYTGFSSNVSFPLALDLTNPLTLYAGTDNGVSVTRDGGATWRPLGLANTNVNLLATDPSRPNTLYAASKAVYSGTLGFSGLFKSTDAGASWFPVNVGLEQILANRAPVNSLAIDPDYPNVLYLATSGYGVFQSLDGGARWTPLSDGLTNLDVQTLTITRGSAKFVFAGTPGGIFRISSDPLEPRTVKLRNAR